MFLIITHFTHIYLYPTYKIPQIQLTTAGSSCSPSDANHRWYKQMQSLNNLHANSDDSDEYKKYKGLIKQQFLFLNDRNHP